MAGVLPRQDPRCVHLTRVFPAPSWLPSSPISRSTDAVDGTLWAEMLLLGGYLVALVALAFWQKHAARTVPRHALRTGYLGLACSVILMLATITWLNVRQVGYRAEGLPDQLKPWWALLGAAVVIAAPMLAAAHRIYHGRPR